MCNLVHITRVVCMCMCLYAHILVHVATWIPPSMRVTYPESGANTNKMCANCYGNHLRINSGWLHNCPKMLCSRWEGSWFM